MKEFGTLNTEILDSDGTESITKIALSGLNKPAINHGSDTEYQVVCGEGTVEIDFDVRELRPGIVFTIPKGTPYQDEASTERLVMIATCQPPFSPETVEYLG